MEQHRLEAWRRKFIRETEKGLEALLQRSERRSRRPEDIDRSVAGFAFTAALIMTCLAFVGPVLVLIAIS